MRIALAGFQHETNTFAPSPADFHAFELGGGWPGLSQGQAVPAAVGGANIPAAGFIEAARQAGHDVVATTWCAASPSAAVTRDAYERICTMILDGIANALPIDAVYLDLHGAMVAEHVDDGEGELIRRVRALIGPDLPLVVSLDLHGNTTEAMLTGADMLVAYRTYPHVDMADTGRRAFALLQQRLDGRPRPYTAWRRIPFLIPTCWQCTEMMPAQALYAELEQIERAGSAQDTTPDETHEPALLNLSFTMGFPAADFPECGPVVWAHASSQSAAERAAQTLADAVLAAEHAFRGELLDADGAVSRAQQLSADAGGSRPVVIADTQDNPGAGGDSDTTGVLRALIAANAQGAALGLIVDPAAARAAHAAGVGARLRLSLGGKSGVPGDAPLDAEFEIESLSDGRFQAHGPYYGGFRMELGASACLRIGGVRVVLASHKAQLADQAMFRFVGIEPTQQAILVVKSTLHFRADFAPIAHEILFCASPGPMPMEPAQLPWRRLAPQMRMHPGGPTFAEFRRAGATAGALSPTPAHA